MMKTETIAWIDASKELPDDEKTVLVCMVDDVPEIWMGFRDGDDWKAVDAGLITNVTHWAEMPEGPK